jgi:hypothetical protein
VNELLPGDEVTQAGMTAVFITETSHPLYTSLRLVIWRLADGSWSHDALDARQEVGEVTPSSHTERVHRLRVALTGGP